MIPEDGSAYVTPAKELSSAFPNWRVVPQKLENVVCSPFCHPLASTGENIQTTPTATSASWSKSAYQSALDLHERLRACTDPSISPMITSALHDLDMAYRLYGPHCMVGSYNGGKDACVIFHLMRAAHANYCREMQTMNNDNSSDESSDVDHDTENSFMIPRPRVIYFQHADEFPEVLSLLDDTVAIYDAEMLAFKEGVSFGEGLKYLVERNFPPAKNGLSYYTTNTATPLPPPHPLAFILGTRKNDPNAGSQGIYAPSSHYMPPFLRVNPVLNWNYGHVWHFLRTFDLPYCSLYDEGFTSLGTVKDTLPCPALKKDEGGKNGEYWPAYMLKEWDLERAGRIKKPKKGTTTKNEGNPTAEEDGKSHDTRVDKVTMSQTSSTVSLTAQDKPDMPAAARSSSYSPPTVALVVIGDELLKGKTPDSNIIAAARALRSYNITLSRVSIISDDGQDIVDEIIRVSKEVDILVTSGGVGPTHDDVTIKSVAEALGLDMEIHHEMAELLHVKMCNGTHEDVKSESKEDIFARLPEGLRKMATLPSAAKLQYLADNGNKEEWPILQCKNIFILPGVPTFFQKKIQSIAAHLYSLGDRSSANSELESEQSTQLNRQFSTTPPLRTGTYRMILSIEENAIVEALNAAVAKNPLVSFGSYPLVDHPEYKTIITLEGRSCEEGDEMDESVKLALEDLKSRLPEEGILCVDNCDHLDVA